MLAIFCGLFPAGARAASHWTPPQQLTWYWQLTGTPKVEPVAATDIDGFDNSAATVASITPIPVQRGDTRPESNHLAPRGGLSQKPGPTGGF